MRERPSAEAHHMKKIAYVALGGLSVLAAFLATAGVIFLVVVCSPPEIARHDLIGSYAGYYDVFPKITSGYQKGIYEGGTHQL